MDNPLMRKLMAEGSRHCIHRVIRDTCPECREKDDLRQRIADLEAEAAAKDAALEQVDRVMTPDGELCPWCNGVPGYGDTGHKSDCPRQAALSGDAGSRLLEAVRAVLYHDERGQGVGYSEAMDTLRGVLEGE